MRKNKFHRRKSHHLLAKTLLLVLCGAALYWGLENSPFGRLDTQKIVQNSILKEKTFNLVPQVVETNGLTAWLLEDHTVPIVSLQFMFLGAGRAYDPKGQEGRAVLSAEMLTLGAGKNNRFAFQEMLERHGIGMSFSAGRDDFSGALTTPAANKETAFALLKDALISPKLASADLKITKAQLLVALKRQKENPEGELALAFLKALYGDHPYGRNPLGRVDDIQNLNADALKRFLKNNLAQDNLIVAVAGDMTADETKALLENVFGALPKISHSKPLPKPELDLAQPPVHLTRESAQTSVRMAALGVERTAPDFYPLYIANHILGGSGLTSHLSVKARENEGLTYGIGTYLSTDDKTPLIMGYFSATPENAEKATQIFEDEWQKFAKDGPSQKEFDAARDYLLASYNLRFSSVDGLAEMLLGMQKYNLGADFLQKRNTYIKNVRLEDVRRAAKTYFKALPFQISIGSKE